MSVVAALLVILGVICNITGCMESMFYYPVQEPTPVPAGYAGAELVTFQSADGTQLAGWFLPTTRPGTSPQTVPTILHVHGNAGNVSSHVAFTDFLPPAGFNLFVFDYRGYGESEGSARRRGPLLQDTEAALDYLLSRDDVDPNRIGMYGQSLGGAIGVNVMSGRPEIRAAVLDSVFTSWREVAASAVGGDRPGPIARSLAAVLIKDSDRPIDAVAAIDRPLLILHGSADRIVPPAHGRRLAEAAGNNANLIEFEGGEHNSLRWTHPELESAVVAFFRRNLADRTE